ncbi:Multi antimicrobial extrusion protein [Dioscorea alata]|uniref:Multi antimicrobial extrusion protein n=1 Tax=Dioscorea alata TaxID=55571 RepID=A0ACB7VIT0_DIOAL|nr:Multi antimicrobial extrusion protein [Dioscorea alata]
MASASSPLLAVRNEDEEEEEEMAVSSCWVDTQRELRLVWGIAGPAILTSVFQYTLCATTQTLTGHIGTLELAAVGIQNLVVSGIAFGIMVGMGSALETLCGQAFGAKQSNMLGVYLQRSWIILLITALILTLVYIFATPILKLLGQSDDIAELAGRFSIWMIPELFAFAINFPIQKFLQAQSKVWEMAWISAGCLILHLVLSWLFIIKLGMGLVGAAITLNFSWWLLVAGQFGYVLSGYCKDSWTGFSWLAFKDLGAFFRLSVASAVMLCLEYWAFMIVIELAGLLKHPEIAVDAATICMNVEGWCFMVPLGLVAAISVRVSNELGAGNPKAAKFSVFVVTEDELVRERVSKLAYYLCASVFLGSIQPVLSGVAIGAGWQTTVAYVDLGSYYAVGLTIALLLGFTFNLGLEGIWGGVLIGVVLQTIILIIITWQTDWEKELMIES